jgi:hypothetical protein
VSSPIGPHPSQKALPTFVVTGELFDRPHSQTDEVVRAFARRRELVRWDRAVGIVARHLDLTPEKAEARLARALRDPRRLMVGVLSRETGSFFVRPGPGR